MKFITDLEFITDLSDRAAENISGGSSPNYILNDPALPRLLIFSDGSLKRLPNGYRVGVPDGSSINS